MFICSTVLFIDDKPYGYNLVKTPDGFALRPGNLAEKPLPEITTYDALESNCVRGTEDADVIEQVQRLMLHRVSGRLEGTLLTAP